MKLCPTCQQTYADEIDSCPKDGSRLTAEFRDERECPYCAEKILRKARVCKHCGRDVEPLTGGDTVAAKISSPAAPQAPEVPGPQPPASKTTLATPRSLAASKTPWLRPKQEPSGRVRYFALGGAALILVVAGVWYFLLRKTQSPQMAKENARVGEAALAAGTVRQNLKDGLKYVWIPPGTFMMGCSPGDNECENEEKPAHQVTITKGFWMGQTPVTVGAYKRFAAATGRQMSGAPDYNPDWADENMPIDWIEWTDAGAYCHWAGGHLPTEAEWEYAARGGSTGERYGNLDDIAWYDANSGGKAHDVAQKRPNGFGLYDMLGNMWEWVNDYYDPHYYENSPAQDPTGPAKGDLLAMHGGDWRSRAGLVRVSYRLSCSVTFRQWLGCGFRCAGEALPVVPVSSPEALAQRQAEAERERQAEEKAREIKETLGDEIAVQVSYLGLVHASDSNVPNDAKAYLDGVVGYKIRNPRMFVNRNNGSLTIVFDCQLNGGTTTPTQMLVRLFDANGAYLTHFITQEWFVAPNARFNPSPYYHTYSLRQGQNSVQYSVNIRDAAFAKQAEFGWYLPPR